jgi:hypothetical protein
MEYRWWMEATRSSQECCDSLTAVGARFHRNFVWERSLVAILGDLGLSRLEAAPTEARSYSGLFVVGPVFGEEEGEGAGGHAGEGVVGAAGGRAAGKSLRKLIKAL